MTDIIYMATCIHHTDADRLAITCPVCLKAELAYCLTEAARERNRYESALSMAAECAVKVIAEKDKHLKELKELRNWARETVDNCSVFGEPPKGTL